jgi:hypothetical protein
MEPVYAIEKREEIRKMKLRQIANEAKVAFRITSYRQFFVEHGPG